MRRRAAARELEHGSFCRAGALEYAMNLPESRLELIWAVTIALLAALLALAIVACLLRGQVPPPAGLA